MMKLALVLLLFLFTGWWGNVTRISRTNQLKTEAEVAFKNRQYAKAADAWTRVLTESKEPDPAVRLNLAHAYHLQGQTLKAAREYQQVVRTAPPEMRSVAQQQLGNQLAKAGDYESALELYKEALKSNPRNQQARYNYELLLKQMQDEEQQEQPSPEEQQNEENQNQQQESEQQNETDQPEPQPGGGNNTDGQNGQQESENGRQQEINRGENPGDETGENNSGEEVVDKPEPKSGEAGSMPGQATTTSKLQQINMSEERAKMLLNAIRDAEQQYLQQLPRRQRSRPQKDKPDW